MFLKLCFKALWRQKMKTSLLVAINVLTIAVSTSLLGLSYDIRSKIREELKEFGPNFVIQPRPSLDSSDSQVRRGDQGSQEKSMGEESLAQAIEILGKDSIVCPHLDFESQSRTVRGVNFDIHRRLFRHWEVQGSWPSRRGDVMLGEARARALGIGLEREKRKEIKLENRVFKVRGIYQTGDLWDEEILISLEDARSFENYLMWVFSVEARVEGDIQELEKKARYIEMAFPGMKASPLRRVAVSEGQVLDKIRNLVWIVNALIFGIMILTVAATSVALVSERREEFALMQSLGASVKRLVYTFYIEVILACLISFPLGLLIGYVGGDMLSGHLFSHHVQFRWEIVPWMLCAVLGVIFMGGSFAVKRILALEPAVVLKGE